MSNSGIKLWEKAKTLIPGGNQLLSKRSEMFLPGGWPSYYKKAKGCEIWDLDGNHYFDFCMMGVAACILGYGDDDVDGAVKEAIANGGMSSLNSYEEVELAQRLVDLHDWADMARFARTGGEACAIAVRIARAASGRDKVAFCGYHGWHDWYLSSNLSSETNLDKQLLTGLEPLGVPQALEGTSLPFYYNDIDTLKEIVAQNKDQIGVIIMEPQRGVPPENNFLKDVREIADRIGAVLIFDEVSSGLRMNMGGIHLLHNVKPDMAVFGKALGNGYPIAAVIGTRSVMDAAQGTFISSTMWTERIGFVAALATIKKMEDCNIPEKLIYLGEKIQKGWKKTAAENSIKINVQGVPAFPSFYYDYPENTELQTFFNQEMLERGYLASGSCPTTFAYTDDIVDTYFSNVSEVFAEIKKCIDNGDIKEKLKWPVRHNTFKRLTG